MRGIKALSGDAEAGRRGGAAGDEGSAVDDDPRPLGRAGQDAHWKGAGPRAIYDRLRLEHTDFDGSSYWAIKRLVKRIKVERVVRAEEVAIPVETRPGEIAPVDFGEIGRL